MHMVSKHNWRAIIMKEIHLLKGKVCWEPIIITNFQLELYFKVVQTKSLLEMITWRVRDHNRSDLLFLGTYNHALKINSRCRDDKWLDLFIVDSLEIQVVYFFF